VSGNQVVISPAGVASPRIIYGTAWKQARTAELVSAAIRQGFREIDTACQPKHYDEAGVGAGVAACLGAGLSRSDLYLQTKFTSLSGQDSKRIPYERDAALAEQVAQSFKASLRNLRTDYLDCLVLHSPLPSLEDTTAVWEAMERIADAAGTRQLGISNCYSLEVLATLHRSARVKPAVVQNRFYAETRYDREIRAFCSQHGIIYQSFWTLSANAGILGDAVVAACASRHGRSPAQILFRYLTQIGVVPLTGTKSPSHMREDLEIFDFELTEDELVALAALT
jgi:diketogulonate reductase-like aldo/keto reductase